MTFVNSTKAPGDGTLLGRTFRRFLWCWLLLLFFSLEVFAFPGYFYLQLALYPGFSGPWMPPSVLISTLATFSWFTLLTSVFYLALFPHIFGMFSDSDAGRNTPSRILLCACPDAWTWTTHIIVRRPLLYQLRPWATKYKVKIKLLNMFHLFKVIWKDYKSTLNKAW